MGLTILIMVVYGQVFAQRKPKTNDAVYLPKGTTFQPSARFRLQRIKLQKFEHVRQTPAYIDCDWLLKMADST